MYIEKSFELLGRQELLISSEALKEGTFRDYSVRKYTQASGSATQPMWLKR